MYRVEISYKSEWRSNTMALFQIMSELDSRSRKFEFLADADDERIHISTWADSQEEVGEAVSLVTVYLLSANHKLKLKVSVK